MKYSWFNQEIYERDNRCLTKITIIENHYLDENFNI